MPATNAAPSSVPAPKWPENNDRRADRHRPAERHLRLITEGGIAVDARISTPLLKNLFSRTRPCDGAVVIEGDRIVAAKCILPVTQSAVPKAYGTRHRAAIGMSEISDAIILVVSEETGGISIAHAGELRRDIAPEKLQQTLQRYLNINTRRRKDKEVAE